MYLTGRGIGLFRFECLFIYNIIYIFNKLLKIITDKEIVKELLTNPQLVNSGVPSDYKIELN